MSYTCILVGDTKQKGGSQTNVEKCVTWQWCYRCSESRILKLTWKFPYSRIHHANTYKQLAHHFHNLSRFEFISIMPTSSKPTWKVGEALWLAPFPFSIADIKLHLYSWSHSLTVVWRDFHDNAWLKETHKKNTTSWWLIFLVMKRYTSQHTYMVLGCSTNVLTHTLRCRFSVKVKNKKNPINFLWHLHIIQVIKQSVQ